MSRVVGKPVRIVLGEEDISMVLVVMDLMGSLGGGGAEGEVESGVEIGVQSGCLRCG